VRCSCSCGGLRSTNILRVDLPTMTVGPRSRTNHRWVAGVIHLTEPPAGEAAVECLHTARTGGKLGPSLGKVEK
jgi:hypothetical protein